MAHHHRLPDHAPAGILHPVFIRQPRSKAIPIRNPTSFDAPAPPVWRGREQCRSAGISSRAGYSASSRQRNTDSPKQGASGGNSADGHAHDLNIYARPFVPEAFSIINQLSGTVVNTPGTKQVDFDTYVSCCLGWSFLPRIPLPIDPPKNVSFGLTNSVIHTGYETYFRYHIEAEIRSQKEENDSYALFGCDAIIKSSDLSQTTISFQVPGLQEHSPYVEEDDVIQMRRLNLHPNTGQPHGMDLWLAPNHLATGRYGGPFVAGGRWRGEPSVGWTNTIFNGRVLPFVRREKRLVVSLTGGSFDLLPPDTVLKLNIQFPVPENRYLPMKNALPVIQEALRHSSRIGQEWITPSKTNGAVELNRNSLHLTHWLQSMLFPTEVDCEEQAALNPGSFKRKYFDKQLNWEQEKAIESICSHNYGTLPFLISGPPGTGKTKTLVEVALQLIKNVDGISHILFCAPSDPAADMIVQRISPHFPPGELLRLNRPTRTFEEVPDTVLPFCCIREDKFDLPAFKQLMACKLVVTTCRDASLLLHSRVTNVDLFAAEMGLRSTIHPFGEAPSEVELHWTALIIDEAAQAMEPETLVPLAVVAPPLKPTNLAFKPLFIMAGDEYQLGPRTSLPSSPLKTSLFARLFARPVYASHPLARNKTGQAPQILKNTMLPIARPAFANLIRNYRSHPAILAVPSALFYADTLEPEATDIHRLESWDQWRGRGWPVLFHSNSSEDEMELDNGGGWYNTGEAEIACTYAASLVSSNLVAQKEVCIMSPFKAQVTCLRKTVKEARFGKLHFVDIGPTEAFQGLEMGVVILCTTRSKSRFVESDQKAGWGIVGMPNKLNVAVTRAKFGLIVIGKRSVLEGDEHWRGFLEFYGRNGLVAGEEGACEVNGRITRLEKVLLAKEGVEREEDDDVERRELGVYPQEDDMWTRGMQAALDAASLSGSDGYGSHEA